MSLSPRGASLIGLFLSFPFLFFSLVRMYDEASQVSSLIDSKATALGVIAEDLLSASVVLQQVRPERILVVSSERLEGSLLEYVPLGSDRSVASMPFLR